MRDDEQQPGKPRGRRGAGVAVLAAAAAVAVGVAPAASAQTAPAHAHASRAHASRAHASPAHGHGLTARSLMARSTPASAAARLARSPFTLPSPVRPDAATAGNLATSVQVSSTDIWALGSNGATPFAEHYNGHSWLMVKMPAPAGSTQTTVGGATALSSTDIWAVGNYLNAAGDYATFGEHWNGTKWTEVTTPDQAGWPNNYLYSVSGTSASDIWAVGTSLSTGNADNSTLVVHWNGKKWTEVASPNPNTTYSEFQGVDAISPTDVLVVGSTQDSAGFPVMLSEIWNGSTWTQQSTPLPSGDDSSSFGGLTAISPTNVWAFGFLQTDSFALLTTSEHWNGTQWTLVSTPNPANGQEGLLVGMAASSASDIWTVGLYLTTAGDGDTLTEHYNGTAWTLVKSPNPAGATNSQLTGIADLSPTDAWAFGETNAGGSTVTLREHWNGKAWSVAQG